MLRQNAQSFNKLQIRQLIDGAIDNNDKVRVDDLSRIRQLGKSKLAAQKKEYSRLILKHDASHPRAIKLEQKIQQNTIQLKTMKMEINRASTAVPVLDSNNWQVHGYVYNAIGDPLANAEVRLLHADGKEMSQVAKGKSNARGYYQLSYLDKRKRKKEEQDKQAGADAGAEETRLESGLRINSNMETMATIQVQNDSEIVFVRAFDPMDGDIFGDSSLIEARVSLPNYRDIIVPTKTDTDDFGLDDIRQKIHQQKITEGLPKRGKKFA